MSNSATGSAAGPIPMNFLFPSSSRNSNGRPQIVPGEHRAPVVLFETPFGRLHRATGAFIDLLVWVDTPLELALSRAILKFLVAAQSDQALNALPDFVRWQKQYLLNYEAVRPMYRAQQQALSLSADLTLDGSRPAEESANLIGKALAQHNIRPS